MIKIKFIKDTENHKKDDLIEFPEEDLEKEDSPVKLGYAKLLDPPLEETILTTQEIEEEILNKPAIEKLRQPTIQDIEKKKKKITKQDIETELYKRMGIKNPEEIFTPQGQVEWYLKERPMYYDPAKNWWIWDWNELKWKITDEVDILNVIEKETGQDIITPQNRTIILNTLKQRARETKPIPLKPTWIQFKDKICDIETHQCLPVTPQYFTTNPIPWKLNNPSSNTPTMDKIFEEWVGKDYIQTLYEIIAYCTLPDYPIHRLFCLIGVGLNGKSCFLRLIKNFLGKGNIAAVELDRLFMSRFEVTKLHKKLACLMGETNFTEMKQTALIKSLTGKDTISFEYKGKDPFDEENYAKIIIATNNLPTTTDKTLGWYRRWCIIDFPNTFSEKKDILGDIPDKEYEALALKCSYILKDLLEKKMFHNEGTIQERMDRYEAKSNPFDKFMEQNIEEEPNSHISKRQFFEKFKDWCNANRFRIISEVEIAKKMEERDIHSQRISMNWDGMKPDGNVPRYRAWVGITWKSKQMRG